MPESLAGVFHFHRPGEINPAASMLDNILFGRIVDSYAEAVERGREILRETMDRLDLSGTAIALGLDFNHGSGAKRLSLAQQQKLALGRALVKRPDLLVVNRALSALDAATQQATVRRVLEHLRSESENTMIYWVLNTAASADLFDRVLTFENGRLSKTERPEEKAAEAKRAARVA